MLEVNSNKKLLHIAGKFSDYPEFLIIGCRTDRDIWDYYISLNEGPWNDVLCCLLNGESLISWGMYCMEVTAVELK